MSEDMTNPDGLGEIAVLNPDAEVLRELVTSRENSLRAQVRIVLDQAGIVHPFERTDKSRFSYWSDNDLESGVGLDLLGNDAPNSKEFRVATERSGVSEPNLIAHIHMDEPGQSDKEMVVRWSFNEGKDKPNLLSARIFVDENRIGLDASGNITSVQLDQKDLLEKVALELNVDPKALAANTANNKMEEGIQFNFNHERFNIEGWGKTWNDFTAAVARNLNLESSSGQPVDIASTLKKNWEGGNTFGIKYQDTTSQ